jgi:ubiquitin carboxyl-terminal hydrolase 25/28
LETDSNVKESDGEDMASLFNTAKSVLEDLSAMKEDPDVADCAIDFDSQTLLNLEHHSQIARTETACKSPYS